MAIRRSDTRRRRVGVLNDEHAVAPVELSENSNPVRGEATKTEKLVSEYSISARRRHLAKTTDLIPKRGWSVAFLVLGAVAGIALINVLYFYAEEMTGLLGERAKEVFSFTEQGSLAQWLSTLSLLIAGLASCQVYALRRHRSDDYVGTYKLWLVAAAGLLIASLSSAIGLHGLFLHAAGVLIGSQFGPGSLGFVTLVLLGIGLLATRTLVEVRQSRVATAGVLLAAFAFAGAVLIQVPQIKERVANSFEPTYGNLILVGNVLLLLTVFTYARFVYLRAQGILTRQIAAVVSDTEDVKTKQEKTKATKRTKKSDAVPKKTAPKANASKSSPRRGSVAAESESVPKLNLQTRSTGVQDQDAEKSATEESQTSPNRSPGSSPLGDRLSKAKAKKLRKQKKQEQQQRRAA